MSWWTKLTSRKAEAKHEPKPARPSTEVSLPVAQIRTEFFTYELLSTWDEQCQNLPTFTASFMRVFDGINPTEVERAFTRESLRCFSNHVARFFVQQIRQRAQSLSTQDASLSLALYLSDKQAFGSLLVQTLTFLTGFGDVAIEPLCAMSLPSTMAKTLYLFLDIPAIAKVQTAQDGGLQHASTAEEQAKETQLQAQQALTKDRLQSLHQSITLLLEKLFSHPACTKEALNGSDTDVPTDVERVFDLIVTPTTEQNACWRDTAMRVLITMFYKTPIPNLIVLAHRRKLLASALASTLTQTALPVPVVADIVDCLTQCVRHTMRCQASDKVRACLLADFETSSAYSNIVKYILAFDKYSARQCKTAHHAKRKASHAVSSKATEEPAHQPSQTSSGSGCGEHGIIAGMISGKEGCKERGDGGAHTAHADDDEANDADDELPQLDLDNPSETLVVATSSTEDCPSLWQRNQDDICRIMKSILSLSYIGLKSIPYERPAQDNFQSSDFRFPVSKGTGNTIRNLTPITHFLEPLLFDTPQENPCSLAVDAALDLITADPVNYFILRPGNLLCKMIDQLPSFAVEAQKRVLKIVDYIVSALNFIPHSELQLLGNHIKRHNPDVACRVLNLFLKFINFNADISNVFRSLGILDAIIDKLKSTADAVKEVVSLNAVVSDDQLANPFADRASFTKSAPVGGAEEPVDHSIMMECLVLMLENPQNSTYFRAAGGARAAYSLISIAAYRWHALRVIQQLITFDHTVHAHDDLCHLLELMQAAPAYSFGLKVDILETLVRLFSLDNRTKDFFRHSHGFVYVVHTLVSMAEDFPAPVLSSLLESMGDSRATSPKSQDPGSGSMISKDGSAGPKPDASQVAATVVAVAASCSSPLASPTAEVVQLCESPRKLPIRLYRSMLRLLRAVLHTIAAAIHSSELNRLAFEAEVQYSRLVESIQLSGLLQTRFAEDVLTNLVLLAGDAFGREEDIQQRVMELRNERIVSDVIIPLVAQAEDLHLQLQSLDQLLRLCKLPANVQALAMAHTTSNLLKNFRSSLMDSRDPLYDKLMTLLKCLGSSSFPPADLRLFLRLSMSTPNASDSVKRVSDDQLESLVHMVRAQAKLGSAPFFEFDMAKPHGHACLFVPSFAQVQRTGGGTAMPALADRVWPPTSGLTVSLWVRVVRWGFDTHPIRLFTAVSLCDGQTDLFQIFVDPARFCVAVSTSQVALFSDAAIQSDVWQHIAVCFKRKPKVKSSVISVFVDGVEVGRGSLPYPSAGPPTAATSDVQSQICAVIGTTKRHRQPSPLTFHTGALYFFDDVLPPKTIRLLKQLGPAYSGHLQGNLANHQEWPQCSVHAQVSATMTPKAGLSKPPSGVAAGTVASGGASSSLSQSGSTSGATAASSSGLASAMLDPIKKHRATLSANGIATMQLATLASPALPEERVWLSLHAHSRTSVVARDALGVMGGPVAARPFYSLTDVNADHSVIRSVINGVLFPPYGHLVGKSRTFNGRSLVQSIDQVGGVACILEILASTTSSTTVHQAMELLVHGVKLSPQLSRSIAMVDTLHVLAGICMKKSSLITPECLSTLFKLVAVQPTQTKGWLIVAPDILAHVFLPQDLWRPAVPAVRQALIALLLTCVDGTTCDYAADNLALLHSLGVCDLCLSIINEDEVTEDALCDDAAYLLTQILRAHPDNDALQQLLQLATASLVVDPKTLVPHVLPASPSPSGDVSIETMLNCRVRHLALTTLLDLCDGEPTTKRIYDVMVKTYSFEWCTTMLMGPTLDPRSACLVMRLFSIMFHSSGTGLAQAFRSSPHAFEFLSSTISLHCLNGELLHLLLALLLGRHPSCVPEKSQFSETAFEVLFTSINANAGEVPCPEALSLVLSCMRAMYRHEFFRTRWLQQHQYQQDQDVDDVMSTPVSNVSRGSGKLISPLDQKKQSDNPFASSLAASTGSISSTSTSTALPAMVVTDYTPRKPKDKNSAFEHDASHYGAPSSLRDNPFADAFAAAPTTSTPRDVILDPFGLSDVSTAGETSDGVDVEVDADGDSSNPFAAVLKQQHQSVSRQATNPALSLSDGTAVFDQDQDQAQSIDSVSPPAFAVAITTTSHMTAHESNPFAAALLETPVHGERARQPGTPDSIPSASSRSVQSTRSTQSTPGSPATTSILGAFTPMASGRKHPLLRGRSNLSNVSQLSNTSITSSIASSPRQPRPVLAKDALHTMVAVLHKLYHRNAPFAQLLYKQHFIDALIAVFYHAQEQNADESDGVESSEVSIGQSASSPSTARSTKGEADDAILHDVYRKHTSHPALIALIADVLIDYLATTKEKGLPLIEGLLGNLPAAAEITESTCLVFNIFLALVRALLETEAFGNAPSPNSKLIVALPTAILLFTNRVVDSALSKVCVVGMTILSSALRQLCDHDGNVLPYAISVHGEASATALVSSLFHSMSLMTVRSLVQAPIDDLCQTKVKLGADADSSLPSPTTEPKGQLFLDMVLESTSASSRLLFSKSNAATDALKSILYFLVKYTKHDVPETRDRAVSALFACVLHAPSLLEPLVGQTIEAHSMTPSSLFALIQQNRTKVEGTLSSAWQNFDTSAYIASPRPKSQRPSLVLLSAAAAATASLFVLGRSKQQTEQVTADRSLQFDTCTTEAKNLLVARTRHLRHRDAELAQFAAAHWDQLQAELYRERGVWGPSVQSRLDLCELDLVEGAHRMRRRLRPNPSFFADFPYAMPTKGAKEHSKKQRNAPTSFLSKTYYQSYVLPLAKRHQQLQRPSASVSDDRASDLVVDTETPQDLGGGGVQGHESSQLAESALVKSAQQLMKQLVKRANLTNSVMSTTSFLKLHARETSRLLELPEVEDAMGFEHVNVMSHPAVLRLLDAGDPVVSKWNCTHIAGMDSIPAVAFLCTYNMYLLQGYSLTSDDCLVEDYGEASQQSDLHLLDSTMKWSFDDIRDIRRGRYLLQDKALELFSVVGNNTLLSFFTTQERDTIYNAICSAAPALAVKGEDSVAGMHRDAKLEQGSFLSSFMLGKSVTQRWENGEISNFQYLMYLNTLAGRTYNDLNQYPVFPWVLSDYTSDILDLTDESVYRDLSKPMGAQTAARAEGFKQRFEAWDDELNEGTPAFHYGTHYSSAASTASLLVRLEPFARAFIHLQGGHFDHPDRMFYSIGESWLSASERSNADVKELTPEFFYLPEMLVNSNRFDLGVKQNKERLDDVKLPPWAKDDPNEFIRLHRAALESDYVSAHLHSWIDLIFGYKQQGPEAVAALNVFHHLTYEGAVDIDALSDRVEKLATIGIITNFGQTPKQLFRKPHPQKKMSYRVPPRAIGASSELSSLVMSAHPVREISGVVGQIVALPDGKLFVAAAGQRLIAPLFSRCLDWNSSDGTLISFQTETKRDDATFFEGLHYGTITCADTPDARTLVTGGDDTTVRVWTVSQRKQGQRLHLKKTLSGHTNRITCLYSQASLHTLVSGSEDGTCIVWDLAKCAYVRQLRGHEGPVSCVSIHSSTGNILACANDTVYLWSLNGTFLGHSTTPNVLGAKILSCCFSEVCEWQNEDLFVTGHDDGRIRLWHLTHIHSGQVHRPTYPKLQQHVAPVDSRLLGLGTVATARSLETIFGPEESSTNTTLFNASSLSTGGLDTSSDAVTTLDQPSPLESSHAVAHGASLTEWYRVVSLLTTLPSSKHPAGVTAVTVCNPIGKLFSGDRNGHIHSWTLPDTTKGTHHWVSDNTVTACMHPSCKVKFTFSERRHHCRRCGGVYCSKCSSYEAPIPERFVSKPERVCVTCFEDLTSTATSC
eukprot:m.344848 g.344848  ORF g.344848 m.344848 type:complete len:3784 (+) comp16137_c1_seq1:160-11511(+)